LRAFGGALTEQAMQDEAHAFAFRRRVGWVFQDSEVQLFSPTVRDEVTFAPPHRGLPKTEMIERAEWARELLNIAKLRDRAPHRLSGGEKKKVARASVLSLRSDVWLLDEPTASLDPRSQSPLLDSMGEPPKQGKTIITATHDLDSVEEIADRVVMSCEEHGIASDGAPRELLANYDRLIECNLIHEHRHTHGDTEHVHHHFLDIPLRLMDNLSRHDHASFFDFAQDRLVTHHGSRITRSSMPTKLRWGILSTAKIGIRAVIPAIQQSSNGIVAAIASRDAHTARQVAQSLNIPRALGSYDALLDDPEIDAVYIPLPNHLHESWSIRAMERGKPVLCEKPFALNAAQVDEMIAAAQRQRVLLMEAFMYRFHPQFALAQKIIADGAIGAVKTIRAAFCFNIRSRPNDIRLKKEMGGGALMDIGSYCVNMARLITGAEPLAGQANAVFGAQTQVDETLAAILHFPNDVVALFDCSLRTDYREWLQVQ